MATRKKAAARKSRSTAKSKPVSLAAATAVLKREAAKQPITITLTDEQMRAILQAWDDKDPYAPAEVTFVVGLRRVVGIKVAGYRYRGDTCCV
jgi:hypothetical protein